jgi:hypothetical protein
LSIFSLKEFENFNLLLLFVILVASGGATAAGRFWFPPAGGQDADLMPPRRVNLSAGISEIAIVAQARWPILAL